MKILIVDTYYPAFLDSVYSRNPGLKHQTYQQQWRTLMDQHFSTADSYSYNLKQLGHEATEVVANCKFMQRQWAQEHRLAIKYKFHWRKYRSLLIPWLTKDWVYPVLLAQVKAYCPDVIQFQDPVRTAPAFLRQIRPYVRLITAQIASPIPPKADFSEYDLILSSLPHYVQYFREQGLNSQLFRLGFERTVLNKLRKQNNPYSVVHIGGYGRCHQERNKLLEALINQGIPLTCWGYDISKLAPTSPIRRRYKKETWGLEMHNIRHNSMIVVSKHVSSVANVYANIQTLYEATGVGTLLVIDQRKDLQTLFEPGKEVVAYRTPEECVELIKFYLAHDTERQAIARAGQLRTLREHTYYHRMQEFISLVKPLLTQTKKRKGSS